MLKTVIFDFDGVIVDSEPLHFEMLQVVLAEAGIDLDFATYTERYLAFDDKTCFSTVFADRHRELDAVSLHRLIERKAALLEHRLTDTGILFPGVPQFIKHLAEHLPLAINSGALRQEIELVLAASGLRPLFKTIVSAEDVTYCKPHPEGYLLALERLNSLLEFDAPLLPAECLVIEDSIHGVESALRAGMKCLAVTNSYPAQALNRATHVVTSLEGITRPELYQWIS
ncbi:MAG: HAD family phosphatase [Blastocatellia bacterium]|nr:HAD family phosphatase [Blastocatellia bacterium]